MADVSGTQVAEGESSQAFDIAEVDPFYLHVTGEDSPLYRRLQDEDPLHWTPSGAWVVTRHSDVSDVLRDVKRFTVDYGRAGSYRPTPLTEMLRRKTLFYMDGVRHAELRALLNTNFNPRIRPLRPRFEEMADRLIDRVVGRGEMDVVADYAYPLPVYAMGELLGLPWELRDEFADWFRGAAPYKAAAMLLVSGTNQLIERIERRRSATVDGEEAPDVAAGDPATDHLVSGLLDVVEERRRKPGNDLLSALVRSTGRDGEITAEELIDSMILLLIAGQEGTNNLISKSILALLKNPAQLSDLREDPSLARNAVEELLRYTARGARMRTAIEDVEMHGRTIRKGERVVAALGPADWDPRRFPNPEILDVRRSEVAHVAMGAGIHFCLGAPLARLECLVAVTRLLERFPDLRLDGNEEWGQQGREVVTVAQLKRVPVKFSEVR